MRCLCRIFGVSLHYGMVMESRAGSDGEDGVLLWKIVL
jgi:hypothetical protein